MSPWPTAERMLSPGNQSAYGNAVGVRVVDLLLPGRVGHAPRCLVGEADPRRLAEAVLARGLLERVAPGDRVTLPVIEVTADRVEVHVARDRDRTGQIHSAVARAPLSLLKNRSGSVGYAYRPLSSIVLVGVMSPLCNPAMAVTSLNVDPGAYCPLIGPVHQRVMVRSGRSARCQVGVGMPFTNWLGSKVGFDAIATTDPSVASSTTTDPAGASNVLNAFLLLLSCVPRRPRAPGPASPPPASGRRGRW